MTAAAEKVFNSFAEANGGKYLCPGSRELDDRDEGEPCGELLNFGDGRSVMFVNDAGEVLGLHRVCKPCADALPKLPAGVPQQYVWPVGPLKERPRAIYSRSRKANAAVSAARGAAASIAAGGGAAAGAARAALASAPAPKRSRLALVSGNSAATGGVARPVVELSANHVFLPAPEGAPVSLLREAAAAAGDALLVSLAALQEEPTTIFVFNCEPRIRLLDSTVADTLCKAVRKTGGGGSQRFRNDLKTALRSTPVGVMLSSDDADTLVECTSARVLACALKAFG